jgi:hypothetical protein
MIATLALTLALSAQDAQTLKVVSASLFKNGYAVVTREAPLTGPDVVIEGLPVGALGTMWITATSGVVLEEVVRTEREVESENPISSLDELLAANMDKTVTIVFGEERSETGVVRSVSGNVLVLENSNGILAIPKNQVQRITGAGLTWMMKSKSKTAGLRIRSRIQNHAAKLYVVSLERGITWAPAYSVDISDEKKLTLISKATLLNDLSDIDGIEIRLITGFPNLPWMQYSEPLTSGMTVDQFTNMLMVIGAGRDAGIAAPGAAMGGQAMSQNVLRADRRSGFDEAFQIPDIPGMTAEDLFFYRLPNVRLKKGDRGYHILFRSESEYEHVYTWDIPDAMAATDYRGLPEGPGDVWHSLKFKNTSERPFTTAPATTFKNGEILGQDLLYYVSPGADALVRITKALDVRAEGTEEEVDRKRNALTLSSPSTSYDLVTVKGTLEVKNRKSDKVKLQISKEITGEVTQVDGDPKVTKTAKGLRQINSRAILDWTKEVEGGQTLLLTYTYEVYVRTVR